MPDDTGREPAGDSGGAEPQQAGPAPVSCVVCGLTVAELPATWSSQVGDRGRGYLCDRCTRDNLRSIEGKLDEAWW